MPTRQCAAKSTTRSAMRVPVHVPLSSGASAAPLMTTRPTAGNAVSVGPGGVMALAARPLLSSPPARHSAPYGHRAQPDSSQIRHRHPLIVNRSTLRRYRQDSRRRDVGRDDLARVRSSVLFASGRRLESKMGFTETSKPTVLATTGLAIVLRPTTRASRRGAATSSSASLARAEPSEPSADEPHVAVRRV
jgi:hypothetical protein